MATRSFLACLFSPTFVFSQIFSEKLVGDVMPDVRIDRIISYTAPKATMKDFSEKLLILDFMATGCKGCIEKLPLFDSLQQRYNDNLQIMVVTPEKEARAKGFLTNAPIGKQIKHLPFVVEDTLLKSFFPHQYISHLVWIYKRKVVAITKAEYVTGKNIEYVLSGRQVSWPVKREVAEYDYSKRLMILDESNIPFTSIPKKTYYSGFSTNMDGVTRQSSRDAKNRSDYLYDSLNGSVRFYMINMPILDMYLNVLAQSLRLPTSYQLLDVQDKSRLVYKRENGYRAEWNRANTFCYEAIFPMGTSQKMMGEKILSDLNFYFNLNGRMEKRMVTCLVLGVKDERIAGKKPGEKKEAVASDHMSIRNLIYRLNNSLYAMPVFDETGLDDKSRFLQLRDASFADLKTLRQELKEYGLELREEEREVEIFVLSDPN